MDQAGRRGGSKRVLVARARRRVAIQRRVQGRIPGVPIFLKHVLTHASRPTGGSRPYGTQTHLLARRWDPGTPHIQPAPQSHPVRMVAAIRLPPTGRVQAALSVLGGLVLVDLPVNVVVVLEQQERADQMQRPEKAPRERWCVE
jgi:hypothetical protein